MICNFYMQFCFVQVASRLTGLDTIFSCEMKSIYFEDDLLYRGQSVHRLYIDFSELVVSQPHCNKPTYKETKKIYINLYMTHTMLMTWSLNERHLMAESNWKVHSHVNLWQLQMLDLTNEVYRFTHGAPSSQVFINFVLPV